LNFFLALHLVLYFPPLWVFRKFKFFKKKTDKAKLQILYFSSVQWFDVWQRPQHCVTRIPSPYKTFYISPLPIHHILNDIKGWLSKRIYFHSSNLIIFSPIIFTGENKFHLIRIINRILIICYLTELFIKYEILSPIIWMNNPFFAYILTKFPYKLIVYDVMDEYTKFGIAPKDVNKLETFLFKKADLVFTGTDSLYEEKRKFHDNISFVPCGVDFELFNNVKNKNICITEELSSINHPIIGYIGGLNERIDSDLIEFIASNKNDWSIVLVGPIQRSFSLKNNYSNIFFTGLKPYKNLPSYLAAFDVCILPYKKSDATKYINPVKLLEYLSSGKPVVSVKIPDIVKFYDGYVEFADDYQSFVDTINQCIDNPSTDKIKMGIELAKSKSWDSMSITMLEKLQSEIKKSNN
jgi:glycosyltransferase involved in cell wall biosynthesis